MPTRSPRPCRECHRALTKTRDGLCDVCRSKVNARYAERRRGSETDDAYYHSAAWKRLRDEHLQIEPLCRRHAQQGEVVAVLGVKGGGGVNHIVPRRQGGADSHENLETLCLPHLTAVDARGFFRRVSEPIESAGDRALEKCQNGIPLKAARWAKEHAREIGKASK
jgi:hypothetical protein